MATDTADFLTYQNQEPLRTLKWMAEAKNLTSIYLTSNLSGT